MPEGAARYCSLPVDDAAATRRDGRRCCSLIAGEEKGGQAPGDQRARAGWGQRLWKGGRRRGNQRRREQIDGQVRGGGGGELGLG